MLATARRTSVRFRALEVPDSLPAAAVLVALASLLVAGGGPLHSALATFALGTAAVLAAVWLRGVVARRRARRRAEASDAAVIAGAASRLRAEVGEHELVVALDVLTGGHPGRPRSIGAIAREQAALLRSSCVPVVVAVDDDTTVAGLEGAVRALVRRAASHGAVQLAVTTGRVEVRDEGSTDVTGFEGELARALARRAGGDVHVFEGLTVLELPPRAA